MCKEMAHSDCSCREATVTAARHTQVVSSKQSGMDTQPFQFAGEKARNSSVLI